MAAEVVHMVEVEATLSEKELAELKLRAAALGLDPNEYLRRALVNEQFLEDQVRSGNEVLIKKPDGTTERVLLQPA